MRRIFADYHREIDPSILISSNRADQRIALENLARLKGARFATSNEISDRASYNDMMVKQLASRDEISAKRIYKSVTSFTPSHKLWIRSNHKPAFNVNDGGLLRRICPIPFNVTIPESDRVERYEERLLEEKNAILAWIVEGWIAYREHGMNKPDRVKTALNEYVRECDTLAQFIEENYMVDIAASTPLKSFTTAYNEWLHTNGLRGDQFPPGHGRITKTEL
ncbi:MAG: phage/plasmid primase, P4 family [Candidatus Cloacimonadaceae bacterium]|nr:phage/plasmid primase, P4 family [Candidatus Cloacimonadaceae bacterium]